MPDLTPQDEPPTEALDPADVAREAVGSKPAAEARAAGEAGETFELEPATEAIAPEPAAEAMAPKPASRPRPALPPLNVPPGPASAEADAWGAGYREPGQPRAASLGQGTSTAAQPVAASGAPAARVAPPAAMPVAHPAPAASAHGYAQPVAPAPLPSAPSRNRRGRALWWGLGGCAALVLLLVGALAAATWLPSRDPAPAASASASAAAGSSAASSGSPSATSSASAGSSPSAAASPAPKGAVALGALVSPSGNIHCRLDPDAATCAVGVREYAAPGLRDCDGAAFVIAVSDGEAAPACGSTVEAPSAAELPYGSSAVNGEMACTSAADGMTCWSTRTGHGFTVSKTEYSTF